MNKKLLNLTASKKFCRLFFCVSVQILKKFSILNIETKKHTKRNSQKKFGTKKIWHNEIKISKSERKK